MQVSMGRGRLLPVMVIGVLAACAGKSPQQVEAERAKANAEWNAQVESAERARQREEKRLVDEQLAAHARQAQIDDERSSKAMEADTDADHCGACSNRCREQVLRSFGPETTGRREIAGSLRPAFGKRGELMNDVRRTGRDYDAAQRVGIECVGHRRRRAERAQHRLVRRKPCQRRHLMSARDQRANERHANRAGSSREKYGHAALPTCRNAYQTAVAAPTASLATSSAAVAPNSVRHSGATEET